MENFLSHDAFFVLLGIIVIAIIVNVIKSFATNYNKDNTTNNTWDNNALDVYYDSRHGLCYTFSYEYIQNSWRAYIKEMPSLNGMNSSGSIIHILHDESDNIFVCWNQPLRNLTDVKVVAHHWADCLSHYIITGDRIWEAAQ